MVMLYNRTMDSRYLDFAKYIVSEWETPDGRSWCRKRLADVPVAERFPSHGVGTGVVVVGKRSESL
ncbi:MAG: hypothetical protein ACLR8Y_02510 [Alistipes indistinctus]